MKFARQIALLGILVFAASCAKHAPPSLSPAGVKIWQANEVVVAIGTLQRAAIQLNGVQVCEPAPCHPLLSDHNTGVVVDSVTVALKTIDAAPGGWRVTATTAIDAIEQALDFTGRTKLRAYLEAARTIINSL